MRELTFFLGLQVKKKDDGIFISQDKYVAEILRKFGLTDGKSASTPIDTEKPLLKDPNGEDVDVYILRLMIGLLMYLTSSRPDIIFVTVATSSTEAEYVAAVDYLSSHTAKYTSIALTQKVFANMRRIGKGFSRVETSLFDTMVVKPHADVEDDDDEVSVAPTPPSPTFATTPTSLTHEPSPPPREPTSPSPQPQPAPPSSPPQEQPTYTSESSMTLFNTLMKTCATMTQKVAHLEQDKVAQALEITKLKQRVKKIERKSRSKHSGLKRLRKVGGKIEKLDADKDVTLVDVDIAVETDADIQEMMEEDVTAVKEINGAELEPTVFDDEEEKEDLERAKVLQQLYDQKKENIDSNVVAEQMQEKHLDNIRKYQNLKRKLIFVAQARKNMIVYLKNMAGVQTFLKSDRDEEPTKKGDAKETLLQESFKKVRAKVEVSGSQSTQQDTLTVNPTEMSKEDVQNMLQIIPVAKFKVEALQVKYDIYMLAEKHYPLSNGVMTLMLSTKLQVKEDSEVARDLVMKIFMKANQPKSKSLDTSFNFGVDVAQDFKKCTKGLLLLVEVLVLLVQVNVVRRK
nr:hypothetical protein [Tanacetum cinerariifolium]